MRRALIKYEQKIHSYILKGRQLVCGEKFLPEAAEPYSAELAPDMPVDSGTTSGRGIIRLGSHRIDVRFNVTGSEADLLIDGFYYRLERQSGGSAGSGSGHARELRAEIPGRIVKVLCAVGVTVEPGTPLIVHEAMKMEMHLKAPAKVKIAEILVSEGMQVEADGKLIRFEQVDDA